MENRREKKKSFWFILSFLVTMILSAACHNGSLNNAAKDSTKLNTTVPETEQSDSSVSTNKMNGTNCFAYTKNHDTISLKLTINDSIASGNLIYNLYEKDKNKGTLKGLLRNDTLLADYTFSSEGMTSVRQVVFLLKNNSLLEGTGSMQEENGKQIFTDKKGISFDNHVILQQVNCDNSPVK